MHGECFASDAEIVTAEKYIYMYDFFYNTFWIFGKEKIVLCFDCSHCLALKYGGTRGDETGGEVYYGLDSFYVSHTLGMIMKGSGVWKKSGNGYNKPSWLQGPILEDIKDKENFSKTTAELRKKLDKWEKKQEPIIAAIKRKKEEDEYNRTHNVDGGLDMRLKENRKKR